MMSNSVIAQIKRIIKLNSNKTHEEFHIYPLRNQ